MNAATEAKAQRPLCVHCGRPYGRRYTRLQVVRWPLAKERPTYRGDGVVVRELDGYQSHDNHIAAREIWDGKTWASQYKPFCALRCALDYAREAYNIKQQETER